MKDFFCNQAKTRQGATIISFFVVSGKHVGVTRAGAEFLSFLLTDRTGQLDAKLWEVSDAAKSITVKDFVKVKADVTEYHDRPQLAIKQIRPAKSEEIDFADFMTTTSADVNELWRKLYEVVYSLHDEHVGRLLLAFMEDEEIERRYKLAPAAKMMHHARIGGLLEHVLSLCGLIEEVLHHYGWLNRDLLLAAAFLHDIGKIYELEYERSIEYSNAGKLLGHIAIGLKMLEEKTGTVQGFPAELKILLEHMILSHHGHLEFGSPVEPATAEALIFHMLDNADSKMEAIRQSLDESESSQMWTERVRALGRPVIHADRFLTAD